MKSPLVAIVALALLSASSLAHADYLEIRRTAMLKRAPKRDGDVIHQLAAGVFVDLTQDEQSNGYYSVRAADGKAGFVYRTLVRRHPGNMPSSHASTPTPTPDMPAPDSPNAPVAASSPTPSLTPSLSGPQMTAHLINVGQGAATLFEFECGAVLVDTGGETNGEFDSADALKAYLDDFFDRRSDLNRTLDLLVITHPHLDHALNAELVTQEYAPRNVVTNGAIQNSKGAYHSGGHYQESLQSWAEQHAKLETIGTSGIKKGGSSDAIIDPLRCASEDPKLSVLWGALDDKPSDWSQKAFDNANNHSVALRIDFGKASFLVSGDLELEGIHALLEKHAGTSALDVDVWQVSHHGSSNGTTGALLDAITPNIALLATGDPARHTTWTAWQYGHPREDVFKLLEDATALPRPAVDVEVALGVRSFQSERVEKAIYATGWDGTVDITANSAGEYRVMTER